MTVSCTYRSPMAFSPLRDVEMEAGLSLQEMADRMRLPTEFHSGGVIRVNGHEAPRALWPAIRPRQGGGPIEVTFFAPAPRGGGDGGGKAILTVVAAVALVVATGGLGGGQLGSFFGKAFAKGTIGGYLARAGLSLTGALLLGALVPPPALSDDAGAQISPLGAASASGNQLEPNGAIPRVVGTMKVYPPFMAEPYVYYDGDDEVVEGVYALSGPHQLADLRINGAPVEDLTDTVVQTREGWPGDRRLSLVRRFARTEAVQTELSGHSVLGTDGALIDSASGALLDALPQARTLATRTEPDEHHIQISLPGGLNRNAGSSQLRVPLRLRIREAGSETWRNLPELHMRSSRVRDWRVTIKLLWADETDVSPAPPTAEGFCEARIASPGQAISPAGEDWAADSYFDAGSGDDYLVSATASTSAVRHVDIGHYEASIYLDKTVFPKGRYEVEIKRGYAFLDADYSAASYQYDGSVRDFFSYQDNSSPQIAESRDGISDTVYLTRSVSLWAEHPAPTDDCALIAVVARNRALEQFSVVASGYVRDWSGAAWDNWTVTSRPAPHLRDILAGLLSARPLHSDLVDDAELVAWRTACEAAGYEVNAILEGTSVADAARIVSSAGYARLRQSELWGVVRDYDRSEESVCQIYSQRDSAGFSWARSMPDLPDGLRVTFIDRERDYQTRQLMIWRNNKPGRLVEQVTYLGLTTEAEVRARVAYDFAVAEYRGATYSVRVPAKALAARRGSLIGFASDMLSARSGSARVAALDFDAEGDVTEIWLDDPVQLYAEPYMDEVADLSAVEDLSLLGLQTGIAIQRGDGSVTTHELTASTGLTDHIVLAEGANSAGLLPGSLVVFGPLQSEVERFIVADIRPRDQLTFDLTLVDEAPEIFAA